MDVSKQLFKGVKNDIGSKHVPDDFFYQSLNFNADSIVGADQMLHPERVNQPNALQVDGEYEYKFLDSNNILKSQFMSVQGGSVYRDIDSTPVLIKSGLSTGLCTFTVFRDKLFISNGKDYPIIYNGNSGIVTQMGAPEAVLNINAGLLNGIYYYAITCVTTGGEEVTGTISNTVTVNSQQVDLSIPIGYSGTTSRKIYRTAAGGTTLYLITTVANNVDLTYTDNVPDSSLVTAIPATNNECPKPYFISNIYDKLIGTVSDLYPTQFYNTDGTSEMFDASAYVDISNQGADNTPVMGMEMDYAQIIVGTQKNICIVDVSSTDTTVTFTRSNVGVKNGYTMVRVPSHGDFDGGVMFVSSLNDVRLVTGYRNIIPNTVNDIGSDNFSQNIRETLSSDISSASRMYAEFFDYKYHLIVSDKQYVFDIRTMGWYPKDTQTTTYHSIPCVYGLFNGNLYNGHQDGYVEREYASIQYRAEDVSGYIETPHIAVSNDRKFVQDLVIWFIASDSNSINIKVWTDDNAINFVDVNTIVDGSVYNSSFYSSLFYDATANNEDYRVVHISKTCLWIKFRITCSKGRALYRGYRIGIQQLASKGS